MEQTRQVPRWRDLEPFLKPRPRAASGVERRLARCLSVDDLERAARKRVPTAVWDYVAGGSDAEHALRRNRDAFDRVELRPTAFGQVAEPDTSTTILGRPAAAPIVMAPTGYTRLSHHSGEKAVAAAARDAGLPYTLSTYATTSISDTATAATGGRHWFQLYLMKDRAVSLEHLAEARQHGYEALVLTIDTTVTGMKRKDKQNGFAIPPALTARTVAGMAVPDWDPAAPTAGAPSAFDATVSDDDDENAATIIPMDGQAPNDEIAALLASEWGAFAEFRHVGP